MEQNRPKKLVLNRETVRDLTQKDMERVDGGANNPYTKGAMCETKGPICDTASGMPCNQC